MALQSYTDFCGSMKLLRADLLENTIFADVTLVSDDSSDFIKAHRAILSSGSSVFKKLLMMTPEADHQTLYLRGIKHETLEKIVQYIYVGEVFMNKSEISEFESIAQDLQLGEYQQDPMLEEEVKNGSTNEEIEHKYYCTECDRSFPLKFSLKRHMTKNHSQPKKPMRRTSTPYKPVNIREAVQDFQQFLSSKTKELFKNLPEETQEVIRDATEEGKYDCTECDKKFVYEASFKSHMRITHNLLPNPCIPCPECGKKFSFGNNMQRHMKTVHRNK